MIYACGFGQRAGGRKGGAVPCRRQGEGARGGERAPTRAGCPAPAWAWLGAAPGVLPWAHCILIAIGTSTPIKHRLIPRSLRHASTPRQPSREPRRLQELPQLRSAPPHRVGADVGGGEAGGAGGGPASHARAGRSSRPAVHVFRGCVRSSDTASHAALPVATAGAPGLCDIALHVQLPPVAHTARPADHDRVKHLYHVYRDPSLSTEKVRGAPLAPGNGPARALAVPPVPLAVLSHRLLLQPPAAPNRQHAPCRPHGCRSTPCWTRWSRS